ncbi:hypothetical protein CONCODRAFT_9918 [Conidiobolus coronatus NRRL 28638]|uniref:Uncharacterized protein n=1 Tax=Conidiobolus coronatus (strain ATCC 28846 / CBS 209.66 / NRRL 28638) TaxID=796925 RepID=A0A137NYZ8_CONC2|nr:hypothetical protein CONCODRAFT_9918 [Conidiobolus coronatus NRRL 28638]|eukprot:KXN67918.1 hypothetical protein CONCODRAFT_9918 [Conidiobolus coronatus NRRL 28638]
MASRMVSTMAREHMETSYGAEIHFIFYIIIIHGNFKAILHIPRKLLALKLFASTLLQQVFSQSINTSTLYRSCFHGTNWNCHNFDQSEYRSSAAITPSSASVEVVVTSLE